jgi:DNA-binding CsgD family transcriptional regulator
MPRKKEYRPGKSINWERLEKKHDLEKEIENHNIEFKLKRELEDWKKKRPGIASFKEICFPLEKELGKVTKYQLRESLMSLLPSRKQNDTETPEYHDEESKAAFFDSETSDTDKLGFRKTQFSTAPLTEKEFAKAHLSPLENKVLWYFYNNLSHREIAIRVRKKEDAVKKIKSRADKKVYDGILKMQQENPSRLSRDSVLKKKEKKQKAPLG